MCVPYVSLCARKREDVCVLYESAIEAGRGKKIQFVSIYPSLHCLIHNMSVRNHSLASATVFQ